MLTGRVGAGAGAGRLARLGGWPRRLQQGRRRLRQGRQLLQLGWRMARQQPFLCNWQLTYRCTHRCSFCTFWRRSRPATEELDRAELGRVARALRPLAPLAVVLAGGEPLLRPDLERLVERLAPHHRVGLISNGWLLDRARVRALYDAGLHDAYVSLDYASPARHDAARGVPGTFHRALRGLELLRDHRPHRGHRVHLLALLLDDNADELSGLCALAEELGVLLELSLYSTQRGRLPPRPPARPVTEQLLQLQARHRRFVSLTSYLGQMDRAARGPGIAGCGAGRTFFNVDPRGQLARCIDRRDQPVGSLLEQPAHELLRRQAQGVPGVPAASRPCTGCWTSCRGHTADLLRTAPLDALHGLGRLLTAR